MIERPNDTQPNYTWMAFVAMAFTVAGLIGVFATYAVAVPLQRALAREAALDEALAAAGSPEEMQRLQALAPRLGDSAPALTAGDGLLPDRVARERTAMRLRFQEEARFLAGRLRLMIVVVTVLCAGFTCAVVGALARHGGPRP
jgi:hypothetical protein